MERAHGTGWGSCLLLACAAALACTGGTEPSNPNAPTIVSLGPNTWGTEWGGLQLIVNGTNFDSSSVVEWNNKDLATTFVSPIRLLANVESEDVATVGVVMVRVSGPSGRSVAAKFTIAASPVIFGWDSMTPSGSPEANPGVEPVVYFNAPLDSASVSDQTVRAMENGVPIAANPGYDAARHAVTLGFIPKPLTSYVIDISDLLRSKSGAALTEPLNWGFNTSFSQIARLDISGDFTSLALAAGGHPHVAYRGTGLMLATCAANCTGGGWTTKAVNPGSGAYVSLTIAYDGTDIITTEGTGLSFVHGTSPTINVPVGGAFPSLTTDGLRYHLTFYGGMLEHATCQNTCATPANWVVGVIDSGVEAGSFSSVAIDPNHNVHVIYFEHSKGDLRYGSCAGPCTSNAWTTVAIDSAGVVGIGGSLVIDASGTLHLSYLDATAGWIKYASCSNSCSVPGNWSITRVAQVADTPQIGQWSGFYYTSLALAPSGQVNIAFHDLTTGALRASSCAVGCTAEAGWQTTTISSRGHNFGDSYEPSLKVDQAGIRHLAWAGPGGVLIPSTQVFYTEY
jgi:hypothetical protein